MDTAQGITHFRLTYSVSLSRTPLFRPLFALSFSFSTACHPVLPPTIPWPPPPPVASSPPWPARPQLGVNPCLRCSHDKFPEPPPVFRERAQGFPRIGHENFPELSTSPRTTITPTHRTGPPVRVPLPAAGWSIPSRIFKGLVYGRGGCNSGHTQTKGTEHGPMER